MRVATFFEKFDQLTDTPSAVVKMRELVMWSAFSGAFSSEERNQPMPADWTVEGAPMLPPIPSSWKWQLGSEVFEVIRGVSYKKNDASDSPAEGFFPVLRANNIGKEINFGGLVYVPRDNIRDEQFVQRGDILIAMSSGSKKLVGKAAPIVKDFNGAFGAFCGIIRNKSAIPDEVLARYFQSPQYTSWVTAAGRGIGINNLGRGDLDSLPVPTPPLPEQKRIVAKVDELMALCDRLEAQQQEREIRHTAVARASLSRFADAPTPANLEFLFHPSYSIPPGDLRKSILTLAVQGKLVPQNPNDQPVEEMIARITVNRRAKKAKEYEPVPTDEAPYEIPFSWSWIRLGNISLASDSGWSPQCLPEARSGADWGVLKVSAVSWGAFRPDENKALPPGVTARADCEVQAGDFLLSRANTEELVARSVVVYQTPPHLMMSDKIVRYTFPDEIEKAFINIANLSEPSRAYYARHASGTSSSMKNVGREIMSNLPIPLPPFAEQRRIVSKVNQLMALVDQLETQLTQSRATSEKLIHALVLELTSQD